MKRAIFAALCALLIVMAVAIDHPPSPSAETDVIAIGTADSVARTPDTTVRISSDEYVPAPTTTVPPPPTTVAPTTTTTTTAPPPPPPTSAPPPTAPTGSLDEIIVRYFGSAAPTARRIAECESGMNPNAVSPTNDHGLFQINAVHRNEFEAVTGASWSAIYDPELNTKYAHHLWSQQGWSPWTCA